MVINTFKVIIFFLHHSPSMDTETETAYDNYKKIMTKNWECCGFQGWLQTRNGDLSRLDHTHH